MRPFLEISYPALILIRYYGLLIGPDGVVSVRLGIAGVLGFEC